MLTADKRLELMFPGIGHIVGAKAVTAGTYYQGTLVAFGADGYLVAAADAAGLRFAGIVKEQVMVSAGETRDIEVIRGTLAWLPHTGAAQSDVGKLFYATDDDAIGDFADHADPLGKCVAWRTGALLIDLRQAEPKMRSGSVTVTGSTADVNTGLRLIRHAVASVKIGAQADGDAAYVTVDFGADGLLDLYAWDDAGAAATTAATVHWLAVGE